MVGPRATRRPKAAWAAALVVLLLLDPLGLGEPTAAQAPRPADLAVASVDVTRAPSWVYDDATNGRVDVVVRNVGDVAATYQLTYEWRMGSTTVFLNGDQARSTDVSDTGPLEPGQARPHNIIWRPQPGQIGEGQVLVTITATGGATPDRTPSNDRAASSLLTVFRSAASLNVSGAPPPLHRGETGFMRVRIVNEGNAPFTADLALPDRAVGNRSRIATSIEPARLNAAGHSTVYATIFVTSPADLGDETPVVNNFSLQAVFSFGRSLNASTPTVTTTSGPAPSGHAFETEGPAAASFFLAPGATVETMFLVRNVAELDDTYSVLAHAEAGWSAQVEPSHFGLRHAESQSIVVRVGAGSMPLGSAADIGVEVVSEHGQIAWNATLPVRVSGPAVTLIDVRAVPATWYVGESATIVVEAHNAGDKPSDPAAGAHILVDTPGDQAPQTVTASQRILANSSAAIPASVDPITRGGTATIYVNWTTNDASVEPPGKAITVTVHEPLLTLHAPTIAGVGIAGESVAYRDASRAFGLTNAGNATEDILVQASTTGGLARIDGAQTFRLGPGETRLVGMVHDLPTATGAQKTHNVTLTASIVGHPRFTWSIDATTHLEDRVAPQIRFMDPKPSLWTLGSALPLRLQANDTAEIRNATVRVIAPDRTSSQTVLERGADGLLHGVFRPSKPGNHSLVPWAADVFGNLATGEPWPLEARALPLPRLAFLRPANGSVVANGTTLELKIDDLVGTPNLRVVGGSRLDGSDFNVTLRPHGSLVNVTVPALAPGNVTLFAEVWNEHGGSASAQIKILVPTPSAAAPKTQATGVTGGSSPAPSGAWGAVCLVGALLIVGRRTRSM